MAEVVVSLAAAVLREGGLALEVAAAVLRVGAFRLAATVLRVGGLRLAAKETVL